MHDLRRMALESRKTVSRKARSRNLSTASSKANSRLNSPAQSRATSCNPSRYASDDEDDGYLSDGTAWSTNSVDDLLNGDDVDIPSDTWVSELNTRIEQIVDRKRSSTAGRADSLNGYARILMARFAKDQIEPRVSELLPSILRSIKSETTEREAVTALRALEATTITLDSDDVYDSVVDTLKRSITNSESFLIKCGAIHALGTAAFFGGTSEEELQDVMDEFLAIVESDGASANADDNGSVVIAALEEWGTLATALDDMEEATETAIEAFVEQLQSSDSGVQIAAGENIALLYEKSYTPREVGEVTSDEDSGDDAPVSKNDKMVKRYTVYRRQDQLLHQLDDLANISNRKVSKKDRKSLHSSFVDIRNTVEKPTRGPKYSTALDAETGRTYGGGRIKVRINRSVEVRVDTWWKLRRLASLRRVLQAGFTHHFDENEAVSRCLPFSMASRR